MGVIKVINKSTKDSKAMSNAIHYVLKDGKTKEQYIVFIGPSCYSAKTPEDIYQAWIIEKKIWYKNSGRLYAHYVISFHHDDEITPEQVLEVGCEIANNYFRGFQLLIAVHFDSKNGHLHCHILINTVSYVDGKKLHQENADLENQKFFLNDFCIKNGFRVAVKGRHYDGSPKEIYEFTAWNKEKYHVLKTNPHNYYQECLQHILALEDTCHNKEQFIRQMHEFGWEVVWNNKSKDIHFINKKGIKISSDDLSHTFTGVEPITKSSLKKKFREALERENDELSEFEPYYENVICNISSLDTIPSSDSSKPILTSPLVPNTIEPETAIEQETKDITSLEDNNDLEDIDF